jgi:hypothetical protein
MKVGLEHLHYHHGEGRCVYLDHKCTTVNCVPLWSGRAKRGMNAEVSSGFCLYFQTVALKWSYDDHRKVSSCATGTAIILPLKT